MTRHDDPNWDPSDPTDFRERIICARCGHAVTVATITDATLLRQGVRRLAVCVNCGYTTTPPSTWEKKAKKGLPPGYPPGTLYGLVRRDCLVQTSKEKEHV